MSYIRKILPLILTLKMKNRYLNTNLCLVFSNFINLFTSQNNFHLSQQTEHIL